MFVFAGGCCGATGRKFIVGGWGWSWWLVTDVQRLELDFYKSEFTTWDISSLAIKISQKIPFQAE